MRIKICGLGRRMLQLFCGTTVLASVYLLLGFFGCYEKWFRGPAGIGKEPVYWILRLGLVILVENIILDRHYYGVPDIGAAWHPVESVGNRVWVDSHSPSCYAAYYH